MRREFTTNELIKLSGINPRTLTNWTRKGWLPPLTPGRGRGVQNLFDAYAIAWAFTLQDIFQLVPDAGIACYLEHWTFSDKGYGPHWEKATLKDGARIMALLRSPYAHLHQGKKVVLAQAAIEGSEARFFEARIAGYERLRLLVDGWMTSDKLMTTLDPTSPDDPVKVLRSITVFNYDQTLRRILDQAKRM